MCSLIADAQTCLSRVIIHIQVGENEAFSMHVRIVSVACGYRHTLALAADHSVYSWGHNGFGQVVFRAHTLQKKHTHAHTELRAHPLSSSPLRLALNILLSAISISHLRFNFTRCRLSVLCLLDCLLEGLVEGLGFRVSTLFTFFAPLVMNASLLVTRVYAMFLCFKALLKRY